jgi:hypothetical protein
MSGALRLRNRFGALRAGCSCDAKNTSGGGCRQYATPRNLVHDGYSLYKYQNALQSFAGVKWISLRLAGMSAAICEPAQSYDQSSVNVG